MNITVFKRKQLLNLVVIAGENVTQHHVDSGSEDYTFIIPKATGFCCFFNLRFENETWIVSILSRVIVSSSNIVVDSVEAEEYLYILMKELERIGHIGELLCDLISEKTLAYLQRVYQKEMALEEIKRFSNPPLAFPLASNSVTSQSA